MTTKKFESIQSNVKHLSSLPFYFSHETQALASMQNQAKNIPKPQHIDVHNLDITSSCPSPLTDF